MLEIGNSGFRADGEQEGKTASSHQKRIVQMRNRPVRFITKSLSVIQHRGTKIEVKFSWNCHHLNPNKQQLDLVFPKHLGLFSVSTSALPYHHK
ncbi:hypothetical protein IJ22_23110 [Paenibacillus naphthalenovorans]|uniref:Uncharacterized protein n=1 Tax=Paenibacillus naphthalenovorans TaxID=162209 RepID=A0A0U2UHP6_9BACL|nr:hypothetical protein IJ22_23110 [Paenibacillus naphthalenovorans]SDH80916.1 hypothetical protein SAMN05421868_101181 [Paenibacillus naphthalenovorans]